MKSLEEHYWIDKEVKKPSVVCSQCALARNGLTTQNAVLLNLFTTYERLDGFDAGVVVYFYNPNIDYENYISAMPHNPYVLLPTKERAIAEYLKFEKWCDEGTLIEALDSYLFWSDYDVTELYKVCDFYGVKRDVIDYWLLEVQDGVEG